MYSKTIVMGRLVADPELKTTTSGISVCSFRVAVNRPKSTEKKVDFLNVVAWRGSAEFVSKYFKKGNMILVDGRLETREYEDKNGNNQRVFEIIAENISFTGEKKESVKSGNDDWLELDKEDDMPF